jgi:long-chain fatty acid transport protein
MNTKQRVAALTLLFLSTTATATNGYFAHGYSASQRAMGGAGTAMTEDALVATINPAGSYWVEDRLDLNLSVFSPVRNYRAGVVGADADNSILRLEEGGLRSENELFFIPGFAYARRIDERSSWGIVVYGNGGMNSEYHGSTTHFGEGFSVGLAGLDLISLETRCAGAFGGGVPLAGESDTGGFCGNGDPNAGVDLIQLFIAPHYSRRLGERSSVGIAPILAGQRFRADGLGAFRQFSNQPDRVTNNGHDISYGYGGRVGFLTGLVPGFGLGISYQTRIHMTAFDKYAGLFAGLHRVWCGTGRRMMSALPDARTTLHPGFGADAAVGGGQRVVSSG